MGRSGWSGGRVVHMEADGQSPHEQVRDGSEHAVTVRSRGSTLRSLMPGVRNFILKDEPG